MESDIKTIELDKIIVDHERFQTRTTLNEARIADYMNAMAAGDEFPAMTIAKVDGKHYLLAGFHRYEAYRRHGQITHLPCTVVKGSYAELIAHGIESNAIHGVPMSQADRKRAADMLIRARAEEGDPIGPKELAGLFHVHPATADRWLHPDRPAPQRATEPAEPDDEPVDDHADLEPFHAPPDPLPAIKSPTTDRVEASVDAIEQLVRGIVTARTNFEKANAMLLQVREWVKKTASAQPWGGKLAERKARVMDSLRETAVAILDASPDEVCQECNGEKCKACSHRGWMTIEEARLYNAERERKP